MNSKSKKITSLAMLAAIAYIVMVVGRIPVVLFLKYDPKDVIITLGGFMFGPVSAFIISAVVSFVEMITVSDTGIIGLIMNIVSTCSFACLAAYIYKKHHTLKGAVIGLVISCLAMTGVMVIWNYFLTPIYMGYPREAVAALLVPAIIPFNLLKGTLNGALTVALYKPVVNSLRKANLVPVPEGKTSAPAGKPFATFPLAMTVVAICILVILIMKGIIVI